MFQPERELIGRRLKLAIALFLGLFCAGSLGFWGLGQLNRGTVDWPLGDCAYMTAITLTTVGYGEIIEVGKVPGGRPFTMVILGLGLGIAVYFSAALTTFLVEGEFDHIRTRRKMKKLLDGLTDHVIVCGVGAAGTRVIEELSATRTALCAVDENAERLARLQQLFPKILIPTVTGNTMSDEVLLEAGITRAKGIICALHDDRDNIYLTVSARQLNPKLRIVSKGEDIESVEKLRRAGADSVVTPAYIGGLRMVSEMIRPHAVQFLDVMMRDKERNMRIEDVTVPDGAGIIGKAIRDVMFRAAGNFLILALKDPKDNILQYAPSGNSVITAGTHLVVLGGPDTIQKLREIIERAA